MILCNIKLLPNNHTTKDNNIELQTPGGQLDVQQAGHGAPHQEPDPWQSRGGGQDTTGRCKRILFFSSNS